MFFSRRTAETFVSLTKGLANKARLGMLCLSESVAAPLLAAHFVRVGLADPSGLGDGAGDKARAAFGAGVEHVVDAAGESFLESDVLHQSRIAQIDRFDEGGCGRL